MEKKNKEIERERVGAWEKKMKRERESGGLLAENKEEKEIEREEEWRMLGHRKEKEKKKKDAVENNYTHS
jgi:hypothetical protein